MQPAIVPLCVSGRLPEKRETIAAAGFHAVKMFKTDRIAFPGSPRDVWRRIENGVRMQPIPDTAYGDQAARTELSSADSDALKALTILYDRDAGGEFNHTYTPALDKAFLLLIEPSKAKDAFLYNQIRA